MNPKPRVRRVLDDRLWDADGLEWTSGLRQWANPDQVRATLREGHGAVVHGASRPTSWLSSVEASQLWSEIERNFEVPGLYGADPDMNGLTWAAHVWTRDGAHMIGFVRFC